jgi:hypothetical protein
LAILAKHFDMAMTSIKSWIATTTFHPRQESASLFTFEADSLVKQGVE